MIVGETPAQKKMMPMAGGKQLVSPPNQVAVTVPISMALSGLMPAPLFGQTAGTGGVVPGQVFQLVNSTGSAQPNQWFLRPMTQVKPQSQHPQPPVKQQVTVVSPPKSSPVATVVSGTSGLGIKRPAVPAESVPVTPPVVKRQRGRQSSDTADDAAGGNWVPLDEYYYGKMEGDPTYTEDKSEFRFKCWMCTKMLYNNIKAMMHLQGHIDSEKQQNLDLSDLTQCKHCYKSFDTPFEMQTHIEKTHLHNMNVLMCRICEKDHESRSSLTTHMRHSHCACEMPYICQLCNFRSSMYIDVVDHFKKKHDSSDSMLCLYCLRVFHIKFVSQGWGQTQTYYAHLLRHQSRSSNKKCSFCKLFFFNSADMKLHRKTNHQPNQKGVIGLNAKQITQDQVMIRLPEAGSSKKTGLKSLNAPTSSKVAEHKGLRFPHQTATSHCMECKMLMNTQDHYKKYIQCSMCRFATSCGFGYATHMLGVHSGQTSALAGNITTEQLLDSPLFCVCGFTSKLGNKTANHMVFCSKRTCYLTKPSTQPAERITLEEAVDPRHKPDASILDILGLVKKPPHNTDTEGEMEGKLKIKARSALPDVRTRGVDAAATDAAPSLAAQTVDLTTSKTDDNREQAAASITDKPQEVDEAGSLTSQETQAEDVVKTLQLKDDAEEVTKTLQHEDEAEDGMETSQQADGMETSQHEDKAEDGMETSQHEDKAEDGTETSQHEDEAEDGMETSQQADGTETSQHEDEAKDVMETSQHEDEAEDGIEASQHEDEAEDVLETSQHEDEAEDLTRLDQQAGDSKDINASADSMQDEGQGLQPAAEATLLVSPSQDAMDIGTSVDAVVEKQDSLQPESELMATDNPAEEPDDGMSKTATADTWEGDGEKGLPPSVDGEAEAVSSTKGDEVEEISAVAPEQRDGDHQAECEGQDEDFSSRHAVSAQLSDDKKAAVENAERHSRGMESCDDNSMDLGEDRASSSVQQQEENRLLQNNTEDQLLQDNTEDRLLKDDTEDRLLQNNTEAEAGLLQDAVEENGSGCDQQAQEEPVEDLGSNDHLPADESEARDQQLEGGGCDDGEENRRLAEGSQGKQAEDGQQQAPEQGDQTEPGNKEAEEEASGEEEEAEEPTSDEHKKTENGQQEADSSQEAAPEPCQPHTQSQDSQSPGCGRDMVGSTGDEGGREDKSGYKASPHRPSSVPSRQEESDSSQWQDRPEDGAGDRRHSQKDNRSSGSSQSRFYGSDRDKQYSKDYDRSYDHNRDYNRDRHDHYDRHSGRDYRDRHYDRSYDRNRDQRYDNRYDQHGGSSRGRYYDQNRQGGQNRNDRNYHRGYY